MALGCSYFPPYRGQLKVGPLEQPGAIAEGMP
jgi:hypothetical protein